MTTLGAETRKTAHETRIRLRKGLDIPIAGAPRQVIEPGRRPHSVALLGDDYVGLRSKILVQQGDRVRLGEPLLADRRDPRIVFTAPGSGTVAAINLGEKRTLLSVVISLTGDDNQVTFPAHRSAALDRLPRETVVETLLQSGLWTALRGRPFGRIPLPDSTPRAIFVTAIDTNPLAARPEVVIRDHHEDFVYGLTVISRIADCPVFLCTAPGDGFTAATDIAGISQVAFAGPHPIGLPGTHIHCLSPAGLGHEVWYVNYQDVIATGRLFTTGRLWTERVISLAGPMVRQPRLVRTRLGADLSGLIAGEIHPGPVRVVSGSILSGRRVTPPVDYLGRYHIQVSVLGEPVPDTRPPQPFLSITHNRFFRRRPVPLSTALNGEPAAMFPLGSFERVMPLDILPTPLLRALAVGDTERALDLGCLELEEEDLALCTYVCPSKLDYGSLLRRTLMQIGKEL